MIQETLITIGCLVCGLAIIPLSGFLLYWFSEMMDWIFPYDEESNY